MSNLSKDILSFENGIDKHLGENGFKISKGQRFRINLARCFYESKDLYIFDDPFASLDNPTANRIMKYAIFN